MRVGSGTFVVVGDLQRTSRLEFFRESNLTELRVLVEAIAREPADFVVLLGDLVFAGDSSSDWHELDALLAPLARWDKLPILGNHDYGVRSAVALRNFRKRFPGFEPYYERDYGALRLVFLDSNRARTRSWEEQRVWYERALERMDRDPEVSSVIVFVHHPPFTNSRISGDDRDVRTVLVPPFMSSRKTRAMISGHVHSYERFERGGKFFIVSGGGGPRAALHAGDRRRHRDDLYGGGHVRPYHYLRVTVGDDITIEARGLEKGGALIAEIDRFVIPR